jgi:hypothetical protein
LIKPLTMATSGLVAALLAPRQRGDAAFGE